MQGFEVSLAIGDAQRLLETLFDMSCFIWFQICSELKRTECISNLIDYTGCIKNVSNKKSRLNSIFCNMMDSNSNERLIWDFRCSSKSILFSYVEFCRQGGIQNA